MSEGGGEGVSDSLLSRGTPGIKVDGGIRVSDSLLSIRGTSDPVPAGSIDDRVSEVSATANPSLIVVGKGEGGTDVILCISENPNDLMIRGYVSKLCFKRHWVNQKFNLPG